MSTAERRIICFGGLVFFCLAFFVFYNNHKAQAAFTRYVAANGNNSNSGTESQPWQSIQYAIDHSSSGDTILVKGGVYYESININKLLTVQAYSGERPILDGNTGWHYDANQHQFYQYTLDASKPLPFPNVDLTNGDTYNKSSSAYTSGAGVYADNAVFDGFEVRNWPGYGVWVNANGASFKNCIIHDVGENGASLGAWNWDESTHTNIRRGNMVAQDSEIYSHNTNHKWLPWINGSIGIQGAGIIAVNSDNCVFRRLRVHNDVGGGMAEGIDVGRKTYGTLVENCVSYDNAAGQFYSDWSANTTWRYNLGYTTLDTWAQTNAFALSLEDDSSKASWNGTYNKNYTVYGNVFLGPVAFWTQANGDYHLQNINFYNNTCLYGWAKQTAYGTRPTGNLLYIGDSAITGLVVKNNIFYQPSGTIASGSVGTYDYNLWSTTPPASFQGTHDKAGDPLLNVDGIDFTRWPSKGDKLTGLQATLKSSSPALSGALNMGAPYNQGLDPNNTDFSVTPLKANLLDRGSNWNFGAFVYNNSNPQVICTSFTYSDWSTCQNGTQARTVTSSSPSGCSGGSPVIAQSCTMPDPSNLIQNPGFDSTNNWTFYTNGQGAFTNDNNQAHITINQIGNNTQLFQYNIPIQANHKYKLSFNAFSNTGHGLKIDILKHDSPYTNLGLSQLFNLTTNLQTYSHEFTSPNTTQESNARLMIWFSDSAENNDQYYLDNIKLEDLGEAPTKTYTIADFTNLTKDWEKNSSNSPADVNGDGKVDAKDLGIMMSKWQKQSK